ncbi:SRPBCC domain-containing protein [Mucilaginibacter sp. AW1-3]
MSIPADNSITVTVQVNTSIDKVWQLWITPRHIVRWNNMSENWHTTYAENDMRPGGAFLFKMGLKNGKFSFDFTGLYDEVVPHQLLSYTLTDGRRTVITFTGTGPVNITECFEPTTTEPAQMQRDFCQAVLDSFKAYAESKI